MSRNSIREAARQSFFENVMRQVRTRGVARIVPRTGKNQLPVGQLCGFFRRKGMFVEVTQNEAGQTVVMIARRKQKA